MVCLNDVFVVLDVQLNHYLLGLHTDVIKEERTVFTSYKFRLERTKQR